MKKDVTPLFLSQSAAVELLAGTLEEMALPVGIGLEAGQWVWVQETWLRGEKGGFQYRADPLPCGHRREHLRTLIYRCTRGAMCLKQHSSPPVCSACIDKGVKGGLPNDFGRELLRRQAPTGPWRTGLHMPREAGRYVLRVDAVRKHRLMNKSRRNDGKGPKEFPSGNQMLLVRFSVLQRPAKPRRLLITL